MRKLILITALVFFHQGCESDDGSSVSDEGGHQSSQALLAGNPILDALEPNSGTTAGNESVSIFGSGFSADTSVYFGEKICSNIQIQSDVEIQCITPANEAGYVSITVTNATGSETKESLYQYVEPSLALVVTQPDPLPKFIGSHDINARTLLLEHDATVECAVDSGEFGDCTTSNTYVIPVALAVPGHTIKIKAILPGTDDVVQTVHTGDLFTDVTLLTCDQTVSDDMTFSEFATLISGSASDDTICFDENVIVENNDTIADDTLSVSSNINLVGTVLNQFEINGLRDTGAGDTGNSIFELDTSISMKLYNTIIQANGAGGSAFARKLAGTGNPNLTLENVDLTCDGSIGISGNFFANVTISRSRISNLDVTKSLFLTSNTNSTSPVFSINDSQITSVKTLPLEFTTTTNSFTLNLNRTTISGPAPLLQISGGASPKNVQFSETIFKVTSGTGYMIQNFPTFAPSSNENGNLACNESPGNANSIFNDSSDYDMIEWNGANATNGTIPSCPQ